MIDQSAFGQDPNDLYALVNSQDPRVTPVMKAQAMRALHASKQAPSIAQGAAAGAPIAQRPAPMPAPQVTQPKKDLSPAEMIDHGDDSESPLDMGAKRAEAAWAERTKPNADSKDLMGMQPSFMDAVKKYMATGEDDTTPEDDNRMAMMTAGAGMAASNSPYLGQAIGQGAMVGLQALQKMRQQRAEERMKKATLGFNMGREEALDQDRATNREIQRAQLGIQGRTADRLERVETENLKLQAAQIKGIEAQAERDRAAAANEGHGKPRPKTYYHPDGSTETLDQNSADDMALVKDQGLWADKPKQLNSGEQKTLSVLGQSAYELDALSGEFKDQFGGNKMRVLGELENTAQKYGGDFATREGSEGQQEWWNRYSNWASGVRHGLFGATLTGFEKQAFEDATIVPGLDPAIIRKNMGIQQGIVKRAIAREYQSKKAGRYNMGMVEGYVGTPTEDDIKYANRPDKELEAERAAKKEAERAAKAAVDSKGADDELVKKWLTQ